MENEIRAAYQPNTSDAVSGLGPALLLIVGMLVYFLPSLVGHKKTNANAIFVLNLFLGWTIVGWVVSLVWAVSVESRAAVPSPEAGPLTAFRTPILCKECGKYSEPVGNYCPLCGANRS